MKAKELAVLALLGAILHASQAAMAFLPNIEPVSILILVYTLHFGRKTLAAAYAYVLLQGVTYGFGLWWFMYLYVWAILYLVVRLFRRNDSVLIWAVINGLFGLCFGALCSLPYLLIGGPATALAWWVSGLPFDILHCAGNFALTLALYRPLTRVMRLLKTKVLYDV